MKYMPHRDSLNRVSMGLIFFCPVSGEDICEECGNYIDATNAGHDFDCGCL